MPAAGRLLTDAELAVLLELDIPAHLGTLDRAGFPRITPIWFLWADGAFYMTSVPERQHVQDLLRDPRASICIDHEHPVAINGVRPNRQVRASGSAEVLPDHAGEWTRRITRKYIAGDAGEERAHLRAAMPRVVIVLRPARMMARGTP
jgi:nitroimidazol reductase NimA-like FMN-containing flavoprotein (pyridoxamine 5'-phosphate oxidase superfamily)